ncbi:MAG: hypothetical protein JOY91_00165, partial [Sinobacteraceae bacterium]|nr:hypothetical protein [Nevskiaceae bacterium]
MAAALPAARHVLNVCSDRYHFTVVFAASLVRRQISLLPSTHTPEVIRRLRDFAPDTFCVTDDPHCSIDLPRVRYPEAAAAAVGDMGAADLRIEDEQVAAYVFTSGSTGAPLPY